MSSIIKITDDYIEECVKEFKEELEESCDTLKSLKGLESAFGEMDYEDYEY